MKKSKKLLVAVTGSIGSGKSTFAGFLSDLGYPVLLADEISKEILADDSEVKKEIVEEFGKESYSDGHINKKFLADKIFTDRNKLKRINSILHPKVRERINKISQKYFKDYDIVFVEAALIYESKIEKNYDLVVLIVADKNLRMKRAMGASKILQKDFIKRNRNQLNDETKMKKAHFIFTNNGSKTELKRKAILLSRLLKLG